MRPTTPNQLPTISGQYEADNSDGLGRAREIWGHHTYFPYGYKFNRYGVPRFYGSNEERFLKIIPTTGQAGSSDITVTVSDGTYSTTKTFTVNVGSSLSIGDITVTEGDTGEIWGHHTYFLYGCKINRYGVPRFSRFRYRLGTG